MPSTKVSPEQAIRDYLLYLDDPESMLDEGAIEAKQAEVDAAPDPLEKLTLYNELLTLRDLPETRFLEPFKEHVQGYVETTGFSPQVFIEAGVDPKVLREVGFTIRRNVSGERHTAAEVFECAKTYDWVSVGFPEGHFTQRALEEASGASSYTIQKCVKTMQEDGIIIKTDEEDPNHEGRGAKAKLYRAV